MVEKISVIYWDSTALLAYLFKDRHSTKIQDMARLGGIHLVNTLAIAEVYTMINRIQREQLLSEELVESLFRLLESGPWRRLNIVPDNNAMKELARRWPLRGSGLWHLATAKTLQREFPELTVITIDRNLARASKGEQLRLCIRIGDDI